MIRRPPRSTLFPLHDALPIWPSNEVRVSTELRSSSSLLTHSRPPVAGSTWAPEPSSPRSGRAGPSRSEEHTSELQSRQYLVCRLLLEKKKNEPTTQLRACESS